MGERMSLYWHTNAIQKMTLMTRMPGHTLAAGQSVAGQSDAGQSDAGQNVVGIWSERHGWLDTLLGVVISMSGLEYLLADTEFCLRYSISIIIQPTETANHFASVLKVAFRPSFCVHQRDVLG